ncbi:sarcosine oxidase subunit gamma family protein [Patulibacter defluvii]|uniref:sarcosine oxidase subunit gamma family protein n=1 Tax=Patulibacter defluvii TaxID=3095358 RepID=UPI002A752203|nr:sarcosine oxidase subunit gamma family protein [Patulibacter sp. DM4]
MILDVLHHDPGLPARSPVADALEPLGAVTVDGRCRHLGDPEAERRAAATTVVLADRLDLGVLDVRVADGAGPRGPSIAVPLDGGGWSCRLTDDRELAIVARERQTAERTAREQDGADVVDLSSGHVVLTVAGPGAREALARATSLDLRPTQAPVGAYRPGSVAHVPAMVVREADDRYLVVAGSAHALHLWEVLADAVEGLGGRPAGLDALSAVPDRQEAARA